ncbi:hypothetical protein, partial [Novosphingobium sp. ST904]|uniref:hypothetical protein n=1 Tax=Novosphingobium sp. ST904 TaxID=1684385 RepID=UPI001E43BCD8
MSVATSAKWCQPAASRSTGPEALSSPAESTGLAPSSAIDTIGVPAGSARATSCPCEFLERAAQKLSVQDDPGATSLDQVGAAGITSRSTGPAPCAKTELARTRSGNRTGSCQNARARIDSSHS